MPEARSLRSPEARGAMPPTSGARNRGINGRLESTPRGGKTWAREITLRDLTANGPKRALTA